MNFENTHLNSEIKNQLATLSSNNSLPHAILIAGGSKESREEITKLLCHFSVCKNQQKPCYNCSNCHKASTLSHPDITVVQGNEKTKTKIYNKEIIEEIIRTASIIPNEANTKVYVLKDVDERLPVISQNSFLKTLEEPPQSIVFILTCSDASKLLETILSRCSIINLPLIEDYNEESLKIAEEIASSIFEIKEYNLLKATYKLKNRDSFLSVLTPLKMIFRDTLVLISGGKQMTDSDVPKTLKRKLTRKKILALIETIDRAKAFVYSNVTPNLLSTWLCSEIRRITWQK